MLNTPPIKNNIYLYFILLLIFLLLTNKYISVEDAIQYGWEDQIHYYNIAINSPSFPIIDIPQHHAQRFIIPYLVGLIMNVFQLSEFIEIIFIFLNVLIIFFTIIVLFKLIYKLTNNTKISILLVSAFILNPSFARPAFFAPLQINDYFFTFSFLLIILSFIQKDKLNFYLAISLCSFSKVTIVYIFPLLLLVSLFFKKNKFIEIFMTINSILLFLIIYFFTIYISRDFSFQAVSYFEVITGFAHDLSLIKWLNFFKLMIYGNLTILSIFLIIFLKFKQIPKKYINNFEFYFIILLTLSTWAQPILAGVNFTGGNIIRLTVITNIGFFIASCIALGIERGLSFNF